ANGSCDNDTTAIARVRRGERLGRRDRAHAGARPENGARMGRLDAWRYVLVADRNSSGRGGGDAGLTQRHGTEYRSLEPGGGRGRAIRVDGRRGAGRDR